MKTKFTNNQAVSVFAAQTQAYGSNSGGSFHWQGNTAFSYHGGYALARFVGDVVLIAERNSSATTNKLNSALRVELSRRNIEYVEVVDVLGNSAESYGRNVNRLAERIEDSRAKASRARTYADSHISDAETFQRMINTLQAVTYPQLAA